MMSLPKNEADNAENWLMNCWRADEIAIRHGRASDFGPRVVAPALHPLDHQHQRRRPGQPGDEDQHQHRADIEDAAAPVVWLDKTAGSAAFKSGLPLATVKLVWIAFCGIDAMKPVLALEGVQKLQFRR
jgi:hypothetical protein